MFAKSPFRKEKMQKRISAEIPKTLNLMAFAYADDNHDNSSESEDEAKGYELNVERLQPPT